LATQTVIHYSHTPILVVRLKDYHKMPKCVNNAKLGSTGALFFAHFQPIQSLQRVYVK